ncbi:MAG: tetratricopeptide repeat protein [Sandaracinaceae bacterium]
MSTNVTSFAVPNAPDDEILRALSRGVPELLRLSRASRVVVSLGPGGDDLPLRWFRVRSQGGVARADFVGSMRPHVSALVTAFHDDRSNVFFYERCAPAGVTSIVSIDGHTYADGEIPDPLPPFAHAIQLGLAIHYPDEPSSSAITRCTGPWWSLAHEGRPCDPVREEPSDAVQPLETDVEEIDDMELGDEVEGGEDDDIDPAGDLLDEAEAADEAGDHDTARALYERATQIAANDDLTWLCLARHAAQRGDRDRAREAFRKSVTRNPGNILHPGELAFLLEEPWFAELSAAIRAALMY